MKEEEEEEDEGKGKAGTLSNAKNVSVEDLNDALIDETEDCEVEGAGVRRRRETVSDIEDEFKECSKENQGAGVPLSSSCPDTTSASESSVTNSPNPRQTAKKGKKGKKKKR